MTATLTAEQMAKFIDHTILKPEADLAAIDRICAEAIEYGFAAVCLNSGHIARAAGLVRGQGVEVCSVVGFPLGAMVDRAKAYEAAQAVQDGASEIDMVLNIGLLKSGREAEVGRDVELVRRATGDKAALKVIIEACLLSDREKVLACRLAVSAGADFVKTSTGFAGGGATTADVALMRRTVGPDIGVKAAGGIKTWSEAAAMIDAGADRIGASAGPAILAGRPDD